MKFPGSWTVFFAIVIASSVAISARAQDPGDGNPYSGYADTNSYFLDYADNTSFDPGNTNDVQVAVSIDGISHDVNVDTGSRGFYMSSDELGTNFQVSAGAYAGSVDLNSSGRVVSGLWTSADVGLSVTDQNGVSTNVITTPNILDVTTLGAQSGGVATYDVNTNVAGYNGTVNLDGGGTVPVQINPSTGETYVSLTNSASVHQQISYSNNIPGLIKDVSNFGIGFDLGGAPASTPVGNNTNQILNPLLNLTQMNNGTLVAGYIIETNGIQLGLTSSNTGYAYTSLNPTGLSSTNSQPDWQASMGQTVINGVTNTPGSIVMDSGISEAFVSATSVALGPNSVTNMSVFLMNSGGEVGYDIDPGDTNDLLNPSSVTVVIPSTNGSYSQNQPPWDTQFLNTGRDVFEAFDMLYDAEDGYMGVLTNAYGATNPDVFFDAQPGGFVNPVPEEKPTALFMMGILVVMLPFVMIRSLKKSRVPRALRSGSVFNIFL